MDDAGIRLIVIGTEHHVQAVLRGHRPDLTRAQVLLVDGPDKLRGRAFRADAAIWHDAACQHHDDLIDLAKSRRTLPALLPKRPRKDVE